MPNEEDAIFLTLAKKATLGDMLSMIVHQWKQPLSVISVLNTGMDLQLELGNFDKEKFLAYNTKIKEQIDYMSETIDDFRNFLSEDTKKNILDVRTCIKKALKFTAIALIQNDIIFEVNFHTDKCEVFGFNNDITQILIVFISNAKDKFSLGNIENKKITIDVNENDTDLLISVTDNGGVIDENIVNEILTEHFTTKKEHSGNGIGLFIARKIATEHLNAKLLVKNSNEQNSVIFTLSIPYEG
jgi:signal transduction histidine kinase